jgi:uncharacterized protein YjbI with pentapeptide repeats
MEEAGRLSLGMLLRNVGEWNAMRRASGNEVRLPDLTGKDLTRANLAGAQLQRMVLRGADLTEANLWQADLWQADAEEAVLREADLSGADLCCARLAGADLAEARLAKVNGLGACLVQAKLSWVRATEANLKEADLRGADLTGADLVRANLFRADLTGANLTGADLTGANLNGAVLEGAKFDQTVLRNVQLSMRDIPLGFPACGSIPAWSSQGAALSRVLQMAATVDGAHFDEEFTLRRLPLLQQALADAELRRQSIGGGSIGARCGAYRLLARLWAEPVPAHEDDGRLGSGENRRARPAEGLNGQPHGRGGRAREEYPPTGAYQLTLPAAELPPEVCQALSDLLHRYGQRPGAATPEIRLGHPGAGRAGAITITVDAASLNHFREQAASIRHDILVPETQLPPGAQAAGRR